MTLITLSRLYSHDFCVHGGGVQITNGIYSIKEKKYETVIQNLRY